MKKLEKVVKLKDFLVDFKESELLNINDLNLNNELKDKYINLLNEFCNKEVEDREIVLEDLDRDNGVLYKMMCDWFGNGFIIENDLGLVWYEYSLEDLFRDSFGIYDNDLVSYGLFEIDDINNKMYGEGWDD
jgi:hypothetical protein